MMKRLAMALCLPLCLAACGGGGGDNGGAGIDPRLARLDVYEAQKLRVLGDPGAGVMGMPMTTAENVPVGGALSFTGSASIRVERGAAPLVFFGDAGLRLDFDAGDAAGQIQNVFGTNSAGVVVDLGGEIALASGAPGLAMEVTYEGTLDASGETLGFDGTMTGVLLGNPVAAVSAADLEAEVDHNGTMRTATIVVTLEGVPDP